MRFSASLSAACLFVSASLAWCDEPIAPLHQRIDQIIDAASPGTSAPQASDAEFLRRASLDLIGIPPTPQEIREFVADPSEEKRTAVVDRLLASPRFDRHLANVLDVMLMERRANQHVSSEEWERYLVESVESNKPLHQLAREILTADGVDPTKRAAARFYLDRAGDPNLLTRDVGRVFFGRDLQCAQCHDHPLVDDYRQADYQGLFAMLQPGQITTRKEGDKDRSYYTERSGGDVAFESVFVKGVRHITGSRVLGLAELSEPAYFPGEEYQDSVAGAVAPIPKFSRRTKLAELATDGSNQAFNENLANRLWAHMMGRGLVHPVDFNHSSNPATHPELLHLLGREMVAMGFQLRPFLRELALSKVYQRAIDLPVDVEKQAALASSHLEQLDADRVNMVKDLESAKAAYEAVEQEWNTQESALIPGVDELQSLKGKGAEVRKRFEDASNGIAEAEKTLAARQALIASLQDAATKSQEAAKSLADDKELSSVAQKLTERIQALTAELPALQKTLEDRKSARGVIEKELQAARDTFHAAWTKLEPARENVRAIERKTVAARVTYMDAAARLNRQDARIDTARQLAELKAKSEAALTSQKSLPPMETAVATVRSQIADQAMLLAQRYREARESVAARDAAIARWESAKSSEAGLRDATEILRQAFAAVERARETIPQNSQLGQISSQLQSPLQAMESEWSTMTKAIADGAEEVKAAEVRVASTNQEIEQALAKNLEIASGVSSAQEARQQAISKSEEDKAAVEEDKKKLAERWASDFTLAVLKPLTPEQICWSLLRVTEIDHRYAVDVQVEMDKSQPMDEEAKKDAASMASRQKEIERQAYEKLKGNVGSFVSLYAAGGGQPQGDFFATADQALFVANGSTVNSWVAPSGGNVTERVASSADARKAAEDLYLSVLGRWPSHEEVEDVQTYLSKREGDRPAAAQELVWGLVTSAEFRFNH